MNGETPQFDEATLFAEFDAAGALLAASPGFLQSSDNDALAAYLSQFVEFDGGGSQDQRDTALATWRDGGLAIEARTADGRWRLLSSHPTAAGGRCLLAVDITPAKARNALGRALIRNHPLPIWASDVETGEVVFLNDRARDLFDVPDQSKEAVDDDPPAPQTVDDLFVDADENRQVLQDLRTHGSVGGYTIRAKSAAGREFWVSGAATLLDYNGRAVACSAIQDVTTLKEHERETRRSLDLVQDALRSLSLGFALFDEDGRLVICNEMFKELNGSVAEFVTPGVYWEVLLREMARRRTPRHAAGREDAWVREVLDASDRYESLEIERSDGAHIAISVRPTSLGGFIVTQDDVTQRKRAEQLARGSEQMLSQILEASPANLCMSRIGGGEILYQSPASAALFGPNANAKDQFAHRGDRADFLTELLPSGAVENVAASARNAAGDVFPALFSARVIDFRGDEVMVSTVTDLSDQVAAREALREANTRLRDAIEALEEGFLLYDANGLLVIANQRYLEMNEPCADKIRPGARSRDVVAAAAETGHLVDGARWLADHDAEQAAGQTASHRSFEFELSNGATVTSLRRPTREGGFVVSWLDVTEQKRAERELRRVNERLRDAINALDEGFALFDADSKLVIWNDRYAAMNVAIADHVREGVSHPEIMAASVATSPLPQETLDAITLRFAKTPINKPFRSEFQHADGAWTALARHPTTDGGFVLTRLDITERKRAEREIADQREMLHQSEKLSALGELLAGVAHELNNPLSVVVGHALMLEEEANDAVLKRRAGKIGASAERCSRIVKTFLAMARQRPANLENTDVKATIETALDVAGYGLRSNGVKIALELAEAPPVRADADQLVQVFANLIVNAEHALKPMGADGRLRIASGLDASGQEIWVSIGDNGPGIPEAIRARIFEPFFTTKEVGEGTGVGLAFCHRIAEAHHGRISAGASPEGGAEFTLTLPLAARDQSNETSSSQEVAGALRRALIVDDEADVADLLAHVLRSAGFDVETAGSAEAALARLPGDYALILSDINMPGLDGRAFLSEIRTRWPALEVRLGFVTGDTMSDGVGDFLRAAGRPYLEKPATPGDIRRLAAELATGADKETIT